MPVQFDEAKGWWALIAGAVGTIFGAGLASQRIKSEFKAVKDAVLDEHGKSKVMDIDTCLKSSGLCKVSRDKEREESKRELQNIHSAITRLTEAQNSLRSEISGMSTKIAIDLRDMGLLK